MIFLAVGLRAILPQLWKELLGVEQNSFPLLRLISLNVEYFCNEMLLLAKAWRCCKLCYDLEACSNGCSSFVLISGVVQQLALLSSAGGTGAGERAPCPYCSYLAPLLQHEQRN